jgi:hypothetical protein
MRKLTELQEKFLEALFGEADGDPYKAKKLAGYSSNVSVRSITDSLSEEIEDLTRKYLAFHAPKAAMFMVNSINNNPTNLISREKLAAAKDVLDRAGLKQIDRMQVDTNNPIFVLPAKDSNEMDSDS